MDGNRNAGVNAVDQKFQSDRSGSKEASRADMLAFHARVAIPSTHMAHTMSQCFFVIAGEASDPFFVRILPHAFLFATCLMMQLLTVTQTSSTNCRLSSMPGYAAFCR
jgi:hypothetical protein